MKVIYIFWLQSNLLLLELGTKQIAHLPVDIPLEYLQI